MTEPSAFDGLPDPVLGTQIRDALDGTDSAAFLARMREAVRRAGAESSWDVLARWAPAGLAAAAAAAALLWLLAGQPAGSVQDSALIASAPASMEMAPAQPEFEVLATVLLEGR
jgi:hypothetical protein